MKLIKDNTSAWDTYMTEGYPFGIEKIDSRDWVTFWLVGSRRVYHNQGKGFTSKAQAIAYLTGKVENYKANIIEAVTA
jgi:hypothetical protein